MVKSNLNGCGKFMKYSLFIINLILFILGLAVCGLGSYALIDNAASIQQIIGTNLYVPSAIVLVVFGGITAIVSFLGCCGAIKEVKCLLGLFFVIMLLLTIVVALASVFGFMVHGQLGGELKNFMKDSMKEYPSKSPIRAAWDEIQQELKCCGVDEPNDWESELIGNFSHAAGSEHFPASCCVTGTSDCNIKYPPQLGSYYDKGCYDNILDIVKKHSKTLAAVGISIVLFIFLSMIFSCGVCLMI